MLNAQLSYGLIIDPIWLWESLSMNDTAIVAQFAHKCILAHFSLVGTLVGTKVR